MKENKTKPDIRFKGFTDDWEQRKLGELLEKYEDPVETPHDGYERLGIRSHAKGTFHSFVESGEELNSARMHRVAANKFILNITFAWEHAVAITDKNDEGKLVSHRFPQFSFDKCLKSNFFKYVFAIFVICIMVFAVYKIKTEEKSANDNRRNNNSRYAEAQDIKCEERTGNISICDKNESCEKHVTVDDITLLQK